MKYAICCILTLFVSAQLNAQVKLSNAGKMVFQSEAKEMMLQDENGDIHLLVLTSGSDCDSLIRSIGIHINARFNQILSIQCKADQIDLLKQFSCINYIEVSNKNNSARFKNDIEKSATSVDKVHQGLSNGLPQNYKGEGVVVGIVDIGFQCNHPTFYTTDGSRTRISRFWQQNNNGGPLPSGFSYGTEYTDTAFIQQLNDMDGTHGTHVAGIAAGSGYTSPGLQYSGVAPASELVFVSIKYKNDTLNGSALGDYIVANPTILDAYAYIFNYAASVGKPAVINLSWGMHTGPHDGSSLFDLATESLVGKGRILVGAIGNEGDNNIHWNYQFNQDTAATIMIENGRQFRQKESVYCDFWGSALSDFSLQVSLIDTNQVLIAETPFISSITDSVFSFHFDNDSSGFKVIISCSKENPINKKPNITVMADHNNQRKYALIARLYSDSALVHAWNSGASREWSSGSFQNKLNQINFENEFINGNNDYSAGENGGSSKSVISVGAMAARSSYLNVKGVKINDSSYVLPGHLAKFSSRGPTVDGRVKPNIVAPGYDVPSAVNNKQFAPWMLDKTVLRSVFKNDTQYWSAFNGTSMAAPHVTGIVALLLQIKPDLNATQVQEILESTATADQNTGTVPNMQYGYGKINAYAAVVKALQISGINLLNKGVSPHIYPNPFINSLTLKFTDLQGDAALEILSVDGKSVLEMNLSDLTNNQIELNTEALESGVYILRFINGGEIFAFKLLKS